MKIVTTALRSAISGVCVWLCVYRHFGVHLCLCLCVSAYLCARNLCVFAYVPLCLLYG